jgi:hypothetical protein
MSRSEESGLGKIKLFTAAAGALAALLEVATRFLHALGQVSQFTDTGHAILSTFILAFFIVYVVADMLYWRTEVTAVWLVGPLTIAVAAYWWVGFLALHNIPTQPFMPANFYPPRWAYVAMFAWLALYCAWEVIDARVHEYRDEKYLVAGALVLLAGATLCLFLTLKGPQGA